jgi:hypothetical protein
VRIIHFAQILILLTLTSVASASTLKTWQQEWSLGGAAWKRGFASAVDACLPGAAYNIQANNARCSGRSDGGSYLSTYTETCAYGDNSGSGLTSGIKCNTSCPSPSTMVNGQCVAPPPADPCAASAGSSQPFTKSGTSGDGYGTVSGGFVTGTQSACYGGCAVNTADQKCTGRVSGSYSCTGTAYQTGQSCSTSGTGTEVQDNVAQTPRPDPNVITENTPCVYSGSGDTQTCTSTDSSEKEGQYCGTVNGVKTCVDSKPTKDGIEISTTVVTTTNPDASTTVVKTDVATKTNYTGAGESTSTSATTTTTTTTNGTGVTTSVTGSCTGAGCPDANANPDADGDGFGDCNGTDCGTDEFTSPGGFVGPDTVDAMPVLEQVPTYAETFATFKQRVADAPLVAGLSNITVPSGGSCDIGSANLFGGSISFNHFCTIAPTILSGLTYLFLAIWAWAAIRLFFTA